MDDSSRRQPDRAMMLEPQVSVARVAVEAQQDYEVSKQMEGLVAAEAVRSSLAITTRLSNGGMPPKRNGSTTPPKRTSSSNTASTSTEPTRLDMPKRSSSANTSEEPTTTRLGTVTPKRTSSANTSTTDEPAATTSSVVEEPSIVAGTKKHKEYEAAKRESAVALDQNFRRNSNNKAAIAVSTNSTHGSGIPLAAPSSSTRSSIAATSSHKSSELFVEPSTVARVDNHDDYQTAKQESAVSLDKQAKKELRNYRMSHHGSFGMDASANNNQNDKNPRRSTSVGNNDSVLLQELEPATIVRASTTITTTSGMDTSSASQRGGGDNNGTRRSVTGDDLAARMLTNITKREDADADARVKAGLRRQSKGSSASSPGVTSVPNQTTSANGSIDGSTTESDAQVKAGLRRQSKGVSASSPGVSSVSNHTTSTNSSIDGSTTPSQTDSDARVKAGLRRQSKGVPTTPGVEMVGGNNGLAEEEESSTPPKLTQTESDARVKAGLRQARSSVSTPGVAVVGAAQMDNNSDGFTTPTKPNRTDSDARVKAGLRKAKGVSTTPGVAAVGAAQMVNNDATPEGSLNFATAPAATTNGATVEADARLKRGLRASNVRASAATPGATAASNNDGGLSATKAGLKTAPANTALATMVGASDGDVAANAAVLREKERLFGGSGHDRLSAKSLEGSFKKSSTQHSSQHDPENQSHSEGTHRISQPATYVQMVKRDTIEVDGGTANKNRLWCILVALAVIIAVVVGAVVGTRPSSPQEATDAPQRPTASFDSLSDVFPTSTLPADTIRAIESESSSLPQVQAYDWLREDPNLSEYSESQRLQRFSLMTLYYATNGQEWLEDTMNNNWGDYNEHECNWFSLATRQGYTVCRGFDEDSSLFDHYDYLSLVLSGDPKLTEATNGPYILERVRGELPPELTLLTSLQRLDIGFQKLRGPIPTNLSSTLQDLVLYANDLTGTIPLDVFAFTHNLWLSHNEFEESSIPTTVGLNSNLLTFFCISCRLTGSIPAELFQSKPSMLFLEENRLEGTLATEIGIATSLSEFRITDNRVSGSIPTEIGLLSRMTQLWLDMNKLEGPILSEFGSMTNLQSISVGGNRLTGSLPSELGNLRQLRELKLSWRAVVQDFRNRDLNGTIPMEYFRTSITEQNGGRRLQSNTTEAPNASVTNDTDTTSVVQTSTSAFPYLQQFWLADTKITGSVPSEIALLTSLQSIILGTNRQLRGTVPTELGLLSSLVDLDLSEDNLESTLPSEMGQLVQLEELKLDNNLLTGQIPSEFTALVSLTYFRVDGNEGLSGSVPNQLCQVETLGIGCSNENLPDGGETLLCGCECPCT